MRRGIRFLRDRLSLVAILCGLLILVVNDGVKAAQAHLGCLLDLGNQSTFDLDRGQGYTNEPYYQEDKASYSPTDNRRAYFYFDPDQPHEAQLWVTSVAAPVAFRNQLVRKIALPAQKSSLQKEWSRDGIWLIYLWFDADGKWYVGVADRNGNEQRTTTLDAAPGDSFLFTQRAESAKQIVNATYFSILDEHTDHSQTVLFLSARELQTVASLENLALLSPCAITSNSDFDDCLVWSEQSQTLAYVVSVGADKVKLVLFSPATKSIQEFDLSKFMQDDSFQVYRMLWSPDGRYVAILFSPKGLSFDQSNKRDLAVFGDDGSESTKAVESLLELLGSESPVTPLIEWSANSRSIFYVQPLTASEHQYMAYRVIEQRSTPLATITDYPVAVNPSLDYVLAQWKEGDQVRTGIIDTNNGRKTALLDGNSGNGTLLDYEWRRGGNLAWIELDNTGNQSSTAHFIWSNADGTKRGKADFPGEYVDTLASYFSEASIFHWEYQVGDGATWQIVYTRREGSDQAQSSVWLLNIKTGAYRLLARALRRLNVYVAPNNQTIALSESDTDTGLPTANPNKSLLLVALNSSAVQSIHLSSLINAMAWSSDGSLLAFYRRDNDGNKTLDIISHAGVAVRHIDLSNNDSASEFDPSANNLMWTMCPTNR